jgi:hypothetical protein
MKGISYGHQTTVYISLIQVWLVFSIKKLFLNSKLSCALLSKSLFGISRTSEQTPEKLFFFNHEYF